MIKLTDLVAKPVISLTEGTVIGTVENAVFDKKLKKVTHISVFSENSENKLYIPASYILNALNNAIVVKNNPVPADTPVIPNSPLKVSAFLYDGTASGYISDIILTEKLEVVNLLKDDGSTLELKNIVSFSDKVVILCYDDTKIAGVKRIRPKKEPPKEQISLFEKPDEKTAPQSTNADNESAADNTADENAEDAIAGENTQDEAEIRDFPEEIAAEIKEIAADIANSVQKNFMASGIGEPDEIQAINPEITQETLRLINDELIREMSAENSKKNPEELKENPGDAEEKATEDITDNTGDKEEKEKPYGSVYYLRNIVPMFNYLIGRKATENIFNQKNEIIVAKNAVITIDHIDKCRKFGKLLLLAKYNK